MRVILPVVALGAFIAGCSLFEDDAPPAVLVPVHARSVEVAGVRELGTERRVAFTYIGVAPTRCHELDSHGATGYGNRYEVKVWARAREGVCAPGQGPILLDSLWVALPAAGTYTFAFEREAMLPIEVEVEVP